MRVESHDGVSNDVRRGSLCGWSHMTVLVNHCAIMKTFIVGLHTIKAETRSSIPVCIDVCGMPLF